MLTCIRLCAVSQFAHAQLLTTDNSSWTGIEWAHSCDALAQVKGVRLQAQQQQQARYFVLLKHGASVCACTTLAQVSFVSATSHLWNFLWARDKRVLASERTSERVWSRVSWLEWEQAQIETHAHTVSVYAAARCVCAACFGWERASLCACSVLSIFTFLQLWRSNALSLSLA